MNRGTIAAFALAGLLAVGCDDDTSNEPVKDAADKTASEAGNTAEKASDAAKQGIDATRDQAQNAGDAAKNMTDEAAAKLKEQADKVLSQIKTAVENKEWDKAESLIEQIEGMKDKVPAEYKATIETQVANFKKLITAGKSLTAPTGG